MSRRTAARLAGILVLAGCGFALAAEAPAPGDRAEPPLQAQLLIVDAHAAIEKWVLSPLDQRGPDSARMRRVIKGTKIYLPVVATGYRSVATGRLALSADMEMIGPDGKPVATLKKCCAATSGDPRTPGLVVLNPVIDITADPGDRLGTYTVRVTLSDGTRSASASEKFQLVAGARKAAAMPTAAPAETSQAPRRRSRANEDARACLDLATRTAVVRCAEKFR